MISKSFLSTSSAVQLYLIEFCDISKPEVATPPALDAFPGANSILAPWKACIASGVDGILAPSATQIHPFFSKVLASVPSNSFWVAHGRAIAHGTSQGVFPSWNSADVYFSK